MQEQLNRIERKIDALIDALKNKPRLFENAGDDGAPEQVRQGVDGFEKVFGPEPKPGTPEKAVWRKQIPKTTKVHGDIPEEYEAGAMKLAAETGVVPVFLEYNGQQVAALTVEPGPWFVEPARFVGSNVEGLIRVVLDDPRTKKK